MRCCASCRSIVISRSRAAAKWKGGWPSWHGRATHGFLRAALSEAELAWLERSRAVDRSALPEALRHNLPAWLAERLQPALGDAFWPWVESVNRPAPLDLRVNVARASRDEVLARLRDAGIEAQPTPYSPVGIRVAGKPALQQHPVFTEGWVEVQDEGSQLLALMTGARRGEMVVDFCAGAGGKTLALGAQMRGSGRLYAFDVSGHRLAALKPRLARSGLSNVYPIQIAHERDDRIKRLAGKIDRVLVDAPCTGLGTLRRQSGPEVAAVAAVAARAWRRATGASSLQRPDCSNRAAGWSMPPAVLCEEEDEAVAAEFDAEHRRILRAPVGARSCCTRPRWARPRRWSSGSDLRLWTHRHGDRRVFRRGLGTP